MLLEIKQFLKLQNAIVRFGGSGMERQREGGKGAFHWGAENGEA